MKFIVRIAVEQPRQTDTAYEMSSLEQRMDNKSDEPDPKIQKFDSEIKKSLLVSCRENFNE